MATIAEIQTIEEEASKLEPADQARYLQDHIGQAITAYMCGLDDEKMVGKWIKRAAAPKGMRLIKLLNAYTVVRLIDEAYGETTVKNWLFGSNSRLDNHAPAWVLRHADSFDDMEAVVPVAKTFAGVRTS
jgi:hypothetical protein